MILGLPCVKCWRGGVAGVDRLYNFLTMVNREDWRYLEGLFFTVRGLVEGLFAGRHTSRHCGGGLEFHDYRAYCPGDDLTAVDWKRFGRTDRIYLRQHRRSSDLPVYIMVDCTSSMRFTTMVDDDLLLKTSSELPEEHAPRAVASRETKRRGLTSPLPSKYEHAATLAAAVAYMTIRQSDRVGLGLFSDRVTHHLPIGGAWPHLRQVCATLEHTRVGTGPGDLRTSLRQGHALMRHRGLLVLISDLLDDPKALFDGLNRFKHNRFEVVLFQVLTRQELDLSAAGISAQLRLIDPESRRTLHTDLRLIRRRYTQLIAQHLQSVQQGCLRMGFGYHLITTDQPVTTALRRHLARRNTRIGHNA